MRLTDLLALSYVPRWVIVPRLREQSVADHSYRVAVIYLELCERLKVPHEPKSLVWALRHDGGEAASGDISGVFKRELGGVYDAERLFCPWLSKEECGGDVFVKTADVVETYTFIRRWGHGPHAERVALRMKEEVFDRADNLGIAGVVDQLCEDILNESDRMVRSR